MSILLRTLALVVLACSAGISSAEQYHGFVKDPYYLILGGKEVSPKDFAADPLKYMRSANAYTVLRDHAAQVVGRPMSDSAFRQLLVSDDVRVVECVGRIKTDGITNSGKVGRHERDCYPKERLLEVRVSGGWMKLLSLGCYNPVEGERPPLPAPTPVAGMCGGNATRYSHTQMDWPVGGKFCASGEQSSPSILFPPAGSSTRWSCQGQHGGASESCEASRDAPPTTPAPVQKTEVRNPEPKCDWVSQRYIVPQGGQFIHIPGLPVAVCRGVVAIPDTFVQIPSSVTYVIRQVWVCQQPVSN